LWYSFLTLSEIGLETQILKTSHLTTRPTHASLNVF
jgi:hypothetical protein